MKKLLRLSCLASLLFLSSANVFSQVPLGYEGENGFCDYPRAKLERVAVWWTNVGAATTQADWSNIILPNWRIMAQCLTNTTCVGTPQPPYAFWDRNAADWSDTWGICAYFQLHPDHFYNNCAAGPDPIDSVADMDFWQNVIENDTTADINSLNVVNISAFGGGLAGFVGLTYPGARTYFIRKDVSNRIHLHEFGHTTATTVWWGPVGNVVNWQALHSGGAAGYYWPPTPAYVEHYNSICRNWNFMYGNNPPGDDGDILYQDPNYRWISWNWSLSTRWCENY